MYAEAIKKSEELESTLKTYNWKIKRSEVISIGQKCLGRRVLTPYYPHLILLLSIAITV